MFCYSGLHKSMVKNWSNGSCHAWLWLSVQHIESNQYTVLMTVLLQERSCRLSLTMLTLKTTIASLLLLSRYRRARSMQVCRHDTASAAAYSRTRRHVKRVHTCGRHPCIQLFGVLYTQSLKQACAACSHIL